MISRQKGSLLRRFIHILISLALRLFFRRIETHNDHLVPSSEPLIFVLNHPNGLIDPGLVFCALPRRISFLAKSPLFTMPLLGSLMRILEALPIHRRIDPGHDMTKNKITFEACYQLLRKGRCIALFPEGVSHNTPRLLPIKTGAARIALGAISIKNDPPLKSIKIVPVGLFYTSKTSFRSEVLIRFGKFLEVEPVRLDENNEPPPHNVRELTNRIEEALREVTLNVKDDETLDEVIKAEQLFSSVYETIDIRRSLTEAFNFLRNIVERRPFKSPQKTESLRHRILDYEEELNHLGIRPVNLSLTDKSRWRIIKYLLIRAILLLISFPMAIIGTLVHLPAYLLSTLLASRYQQHGADNIIPTVKILTAIVFIPLTWITSCITIYFLYGWKLALVTLPALVVCGYIAMRWLEEFYDMRGWYKSIRLLLKNRALFLRLLLERKALHSEIEKMVNG
jgi:glycerol-3-phosphate O-acyltransferase / dihydroxyacetone phosphate acyltransferase